MAGYWGTISATTVVWMYGCVFCAAGCIWCRWRSASCHYVIMLSFWEWNYGLNLVLGNVNLIGNIFGLEWNEASLKYTSYYKLVCPNNFRRRECFAAIYLQTNTNQCYSFTDEFKPFRTKPVRFSRTPSFKRSRYFSAASSNVSEQSRNNPSLYLGVFWAGHVDTRH